MSDRISGKSIIALNAIVLLITLPMTTKPKAPASRPQNPKALQKRLAGPNPLQQADNRWQRTVRYGWDKGGAKGGR
ncbi:MAG: hypothetical protein WCL27_09345 [Betaproteobacteria bacterium]